MITTVFFMHETYLPHNVIHRWGRRHLSAARGRRGRAGPRALARHARSLEPRRYVRHRQRLVPAAAREAVT